MLHKPNTISSARAQGESIEWLPSKKGGFYARTSLGTISIYVDKAGRWKLSHHSPETGLKYLASGYASLDDAREAAIAYIIGLDRRARA